VPRLEKLKIGVQQMLRFSTYEEAFEELLENEGLKKKAAKSGISYGTLKKVYNRGMAAWRTGHRPGTTPQQWGMARVNSYITKGKGTYYGADSDLSGKGKKKKDKKEAYVSYAQQKAAHASMAERGKKKKKNESVGEAKVQEISKTLAKNYISKASRDTYHLGKRQGSADAIDRLGGTHPDQKYKSGPERKAVKRVVGIDRAAQRIATGKGYYGQKKNEAMSDAEKAAHQKAIDAFKAKGGKIKKLKPGYAQGYHGKADPAAGMKGMMDKGDTGAIGTRKKVGSMR
tara:strand:- start:1196 stop:2053 length:858 start_codon:yes stop_codon:yes gene_type:complete